jgi:protein-disulfide isomerase
MSDSSRPGRVPAGATPDGDGILVGEGRVRVDAFIDFLCPFCRRFELSSESVLGELLRGGLIALAYHPMNFLDEASTTAYSTRAAAASGCAADQDRFLAYAHELFVSQPAEGGPGLSDDELIRLAGPAGLDETAFASSVANGTYLDWPPYVTARAVAAGVEATPTVLVAGVPVTPDARAIAAAVEKAGPA